MAKVRQTAPAEACVVDDIAKVMKNDPIQHLWRKLISMTAGLATPDVIDKENIQQTAKEVGGYLKDRPSPPTVTPHREVRGQV